MSRELYTVMYHYTRDLKNSRFPNIKGMDAQLFSEQLDFFVHHFNVVTMEQVVEAWNGGEELPPNALLITFDDGYIDNYTVAFPMLKQRGIQGSFFVPGKNIEENILLDVNKIHFILASASEETLLSELLKLMDYYRGSEFEFPANDELYEKYAIPNRFDRAQTIFIKRMLQTVLPETLRGQIASKLFEKYVGVREDVFARELYVNHDQIKLMQSDGMYIGLHGYDHYWLANLTQDELEKDILKMLDVMGQYVDTRRWVMNYPYGNYSDSVIKTLEKNGCVLAMTTEARVGNLDRDSRFTIPRMDCNDFPPKSNNWKEI